MGYFAKAERQSICRIDDKVNKENLIIMKPLKIFKLNENKTNNAVSDSTQESTPSSEFDRIYNGIVAELDAMSVEPPTSPFMIGYICGINGRDLQSSIEIRDQMQGCK